MIQIIVFLMIIRSIFGIQTKRIGYIGKNNRIDFKPDNLIEFQIIFNHNEGKALLFKANKEQNNDDCIYDLRGEKANIYGKLDICTGMISYNIDNKNYEVLDLNKTTDKNTRKNTIMKYELRLFLFYDFLTIRDEKLFNTNLLKKIIEKTNQIYSDNDIPLDIVLAGKSYVNPYYLNMKKNPENIIEHLEEFKKFIEPVRFSPFNITTPLGRSDMVLLVSKQPNNGLEKGISYFKGLVSLDKSYMLIYTDDDDNYEYISKKIAHEIAHTLGVSHDSINGSIMSSRASKNSTDDTKFTDESKQIILDFLDRYRDFFDKNIGADTEKTEEHPITAEDDAEKFINSKRKHSFNDIVRKRLNGNIPQSIPYGYYFGFNILVYTISLFLLIYYFSINV